MVPHFLTALDGAPSELGQHILDGSPVIERWFRLEWTQHTPVFYSSVDIRNAGFKLAPVDTNLYPGGWNNLSAEMLLPAAQAARLALQRRAPQARRLLLVPENHTRNGFYLQNVAQLQRILGDAGLEVRIGSLNPDIAEATALALPDGGTLTLEPLLRRGNRIGLRDFDPCAILVNNDLSAGVTGILEDLQGQLLLPPLHAGWHVRRKSRHFQAYDEVCKRFGKLLGLDPWLLQALFDHCDNLDFAEGHSLERLQEQANALLNRIRRKYKEYGIAERPFIVVKADNGTYGMGIMMVRDASELGALNRRTRNKMAVVKDGLQVSEVILQEGVRTRECVGGATAEPVAYMIDRAVVGGFYRLHAERGADENLNAPGARFQPMACDPAALSVQHGQPPGTSGPNLFYLYGVVARLAALAASCELEQGPARAAEELACA